MDFPKDWIAFFVEDRTYVYSSQDEFFSESGNYAIEDYTIHFLSGRLADQKAAVQENLIILSDRTRYEKISQMPGVIGFEDEQNQK